MNENILLKPLLTIIKENTYHDIVDGSEIQQKNTRHG